MVGREIRPDIRTGRVERRTLAQVIGTAGRQRVAVIVVAVRVLDAFGIAIAEVGLDRAAESRNVGTDVEGIAVSIGRVLPEAVEFAVQARTKMSSDPRKQQRFRRRTFPGQFFNNLDIEIIQLTLQAI